MGHYNVRRLVVVQLYVEAEGGLTEIFLQTSKSYWC